MNTNTNKDINKYNLWTAIITPLDEKGAIHLDNLESLLKEQDQAGNGILILGSTGEALNLSESERKDILRFATSLELSVPLMVGVGGIHLESTIEWLSFCETLKVDCYLFVTPLYAKPGVIGQTKWFQTLLDSVTKPCVLYNVPSRTGKQLEFEVVTNLVNHENFWGIKEASGSTEDFKTYVTLAKDKKVFSGDDILMSEFAKLGAAGLISVASNSWPKSTNLYCQKALKNELSDSDLVLWKDACNQLFTASNPIPVKCLINKEGRILTNNLKLPLTSKDLKESDLEKLVSISVKIKEWNK